MSEVAQMRVIGIHRMGFSFPVMADRASELPARAEVPWTSRPSLVLVGNAVDGR